MKTRILLFLFFGLAMSQAKAQDEGAKKRSEATLTALSDDNFSPSVFLGSTSKNPLSSNITLDTKDQKLDLQGLLFKCQKSGILGTINVSANNENNVSSIFSGTKLSPKFSGNFELTLPIISWLSHQKLSDTEKKRLNDEAESNKTFSDPETYKYHKMLKNLKYYDVRRINYGYLSLGLKAEGAKYYLIDTTQNLNDAITKKNYNGWKAYAGYTFINYNVKKRHSIIHQIDISYGETNNVDDLDEYTISNSTTLQSGINKGTFDRKRTGYIDPYILQHQGKISYEFNYYPMDGESTRIGFIFGGQFSYNSKSSNSTQFNVGLNYPVKLYGKDNDGKKVCVSAILSSSIPSNYATDSDFTFGNSLGVTLKVATPIQLNFKN